MATEKRLILADATVDAFTKWLTSTYDGRMPVDVVNEIPTVDAVEVVHGRCVYVRDEELIDHWECSVCSKYVPWECHRDWNYCPHCGAKMDGGNP